MELRLIFREGIADYDGKLAKYNYHTVIVSFESNNPAFKDNRDLPEVIGCEWLEKEGK